LAHHLDTLEEAGLIRRSTSSGDGRRRYVHLLRGALDRLTIGSIVQPGPALFICTANSARSQLAAAFWKHLTGERADSAGTHPADHVHPGAVAAAERAGLELSSAEPRQLTEVEPFPALVVTVCDRAHEELRTGETWLHWSIPDPVRVNTKAAFDTALAELRGRIESVLGDRAMAS